MSTDVATVTDSQPLTSVVRLFGDYDHLAFPVVDPNGQMIGILSMDCFKNLLANQETFRWLLATDVMLPIRGALTTDDTLENALATMKEMNLDQIPVVDSPDSAHPIGMLDMRKANQQVKQQLVLRRQSSLPQSSEQAPAPTV